MSEGIEISKTAECIEATGRAILIRDSGATKVFLEAGLSSPIAEFWVPQSQIHDDSEVWKPGQTGRLVVNEWWAEKKGLI